MRLTGLIVQSRLCIVRCIGYLTSHCAPGRTYNRSAERAWIRMAIVDKDITINRTSLVALTLFKGAKECRSVRQAREIVQCALTQGAPIDWAKKLDGTPYVFVSNKGVLWLREKHGWKKPTRRGKKKRTIQEMNQPTGERAELMKQELHKMFTKHLNEAVDSVTNTSS